MVEERENVNGKQIGLSLNDEPYRIRQCSLQRTTVGRPTIASGNPKPGSISEGETSFTLTGLLYSNSREGDFSQGAVELDGE